MKNCGSISKNIQKHKRLHKDWINCYDPCSKDLTECGILAKDELWRRELPNQRKVEKIFIYGVNAKKDAICLRIKTEPIIDEKSEELIGYRYSYQIYIETGNNNHYSCDESGIQYNNCGNRVEYKFPGLLLEVLEPLQKWRIKFNGFLFDNNNEKVLVRLRLLWFSNAEVFDFRTNCNTKFMSKQTKGFGVEIDDIFEDRYVGCGQLKGILQLNEEIEEEVYFWGSRSKAIQLTDNSSFRHCFQKSLIMGYSEKGISFELIKITQKDNNKSFHYGWGLAAHGSVYPIQNIIFDDKQSLFPNTFKLQLNGKYLTVKDMKIRSNGVCDMTINGHKSSGILVENYELINQIKKISPNTDLVNLFKVRESQELVLCFDDKIASNESLTGGKGSSLSMLKSLSQLKTDNCFVVPNGFVVTTNAYQMLLRENPNLNKLIDNLQTICWSEDRKNLKIESENVMHMFTKVEIPFLVKAMIRDSLKTFDANANYDDILVAVRSSACGEDSEDMSAAGQMTTYLGVKGLEEICNSVLKCWSSQFNIIAVEYKRSYGQLINSPMAVVVQEMIDCDVAGVMFTCDPLKGTPNKLSINANYGIGESVVSASVNPDNISLLVDMDSNSFDSKKRINSIHNMIIGAKESAIKISKSSGFGTTEVESNASVKDKCCLSDEEIRKIGEIGLKIEYYFGSARDIEWGLKDGKYYLFQSRPVTHLSSFSEWELSHEFDSGHLDEAEYITKANLGEVMPGALCPINLTAILRSMWLHISQQYMMIFNMKYTPQRKIMQAITIYNCSAFFSLKDAGFFGFAPEDKEDFAHKSLVLATFGHPVEDEELRADAFERNGMPGFRMKLRKQNLAIKNIMSSKKQLVSLINSKQSLDFLKGHNFNNSSEMFEVFADNLTLMAECLKAHMDVSIKSTMQNLMLLSVLSNGNINVKTNENLLIDFANVLSKTGNSIVSADVPQAINQLAKSIAKPETFKQMSAEEALEWLEQTSDETGKLYKQFMIDYGFRGYKEWDVMSNTWNDDKLQLVTTIQMMLPLRQNQNETVMTLSQLIRRIKTPMSKFQRMLLKRFILPACHQSIADREMSKSFDIQCIDKFRQFLRHMSKMMCYREGRLPEPDLIFFLTVHELKALTEFRDPKIVMKAKQRKKNFPKIDKYIYDETCIGANIRPRNYVDKNTIKLKYLNGPNAIMSGTPVCTGSITGKVCVAKCFDDAKNLQTGDILVTYCTDIGWSPYLPMISGLITEIGGLVSHGAVIAREYGIPCLVGVVDACEQLSSGDTVLLDADNSQIVLMRTTEN